jgi:hypothetical protein
MLSLRRIIACLLAVFVTTISVGSQGAPVRSVADTAWAIGVDHGHLPLKLRTSYAKALVEVAAKHKFDTLTAVSLIWHESGWRAGAIGDGGDAIGLAQIHYKQLCVRHPDRCETVRLQLLDPIYSLRALGRTITLKRKWCRQQTGRSALLARWLHAYGYKQRKNLKCNMRRTKTGWRDKSVPTEIRRIMRYRRKLISKLSKQRPKRRRRR